MPHSELLLTLLILTGVSAGRSAPESVSLASVVLGELEDCVLVTDIRDEPAEWKLAATVAVGLLNRRFRRPAALALNAPTDWKWAEESRAHLSGARWVAASAADLVGYAVFVGAAQFVVGYSPEEPWAIPTVVTMAGVKAALPVPNLKDNITSNINNAIPKEAQIPQLVQIAGVPPRGSQSLEWQMLNLTLGLDVFGPNVNATEAASDPFLGAGGLKIFDVVSKRWSDELEATLWAFQHLYPQCSQTSETVALQTPELLSQGYLTDLIVSERMFAFYLPEMCNAGPQQLLFREIVKGATDAGKQLKVMGYFTPHEVVADCSLQHTEMSVVSDWSPNLSFYSRMARLEVPLQQIAVPPAPNFDASRTYIAVINSDGDNMQMENNGNRHGMEERVRLCSIAGGSCPPLAWTMSNQLLTYGPALLSWYYEQAQRTGHDTFLMGPSGFSFLHPAAIATDSPILTEFVDNTIAAAQNLSMTAYVHWDIDANGFSQQQSHACMSPLSTRAGHGPHFHAGQGHHCPQSLPEKIQDSHAVTSTGSGAASNAAAREAYIRRFEGSPVQTVFAPQEYSLPEWVGAVAIIQEQLRWTSDKLTADVVQQVSNIPKGTLGYVYKIFDVEMQEFHNFAASVADHVTLVDYRQMYQIAQQKRGNARQRVDLL